jgi:predicted alpha/beta-hydrolase family hydrolase
MVFLVGDRVIEPRQPGGRFAVELPNRCQDECLTGGSKRAERFVVRLAQHGEQLCFFRVMRAIPAVLAQERRIRLPREITVGARELPDSHQTGLDDVLCQLGDGSALGRRLEFKAIGWNVLAFCNHPFARVRPRLKRFVKQMGTWCHNPRVQQNRGLSVYPTTDAGAALILAHGAGAGQRSAFMVGAARALAERGVVTATFDFPYMAQGRKVPDKGPVLEEAWRAVITEAAGRADLAGRPLFIGGKSMGGRIASQVAAAGGLPIAGLVFFGYPLHPPGKPAQRRDAHLPAITAPMLFVQGSNDAFGSADEIRALLPRLNAATILHEVAGGDHSLKVPARGGRTPASVLADVFDVVAQFIRSTTKA